MFQWINRTIPCTWNLKVEREDKLSAECYIQITTCWQRLDTTSVPNPDVNHSEVFPKIMFDNFKKVVPTRNPIINGKWEEQKEKDNKYVISKKNLCYSFTLHLQGQQKSQHLYYISSFLFHKRNTLADYTKVNLQTDVAWCDMSDN